MFDSDAVISQVHISNLDHQFLHHSSKPSHFRSVPMVTGPLGGSSNHFDSFCAFWLMYNIYQGNLPSGYLRYTFWLVIKHLP